MQASNPAFPAPPGQSPFPQPSGSFPAPTQQALPMPGSGALNAQLDQMFPQPPMQQPPMQQPPMQQPPMQQPPMQQPPTQQPPMPPQPQPTHFGYAALKLSQQQALLPTDPPEVHVAYQMLQANPQQIQPMLQYAPQTVRTANPNENLFVNGSVVTTAFPGQAVPAPAAPPGWVPNGQPGQLQAAPGGFVPPDAPVAALANTTPEEGKKRGRKKAVDASGDTMATVVILLGRIADALEDIVEQSKKG